MFQPEPEPFERVAFATANGKLTDAAMHDVAVRDAISRRHRVARAERAVNVLLALGLVLLFAPLFVYVALAVRTTGRPVIFGHKRLGRNGRPFTCYKFRTMVPNAEAVLKDLLARDPAARAEWEANFKLRRDPRITRIGLFLRRSSLDELPQLWNVLRGDMNLVGPRPIVPEELERYGDQAWAYLCCRPGLTGIWQVSGRSQTSYADRVALDVAYAKSRSLFSDIAILAKTVRVVLLGRGAY